MTEQLKIGLKGHQEKIVTEELTAAHIGSGSVRVFATPMMIALMELTCRTAVKPYLDEGEETVGTLVNVTHDAASPVGMKVVCDCELVEIDRRRLVFKVVVSDDHGVVGQGLHERFVINTQKFLSKVYPEQ